MRPAAHGPGGGAGAGEALDRVLRRTTGAPLRSGNQLTLLRNGHETYVDWLTAIAHARRWIHLDNYIFRDDEVGRLFADALRERAAAGVCVRVLVDWFGTQNVPDEFWQRMRAAGVEVRIVNPPSLSSPLAAVRRDHRKLLTVDGEYASTGGVCIGDDWLERSPLTGLPWRDTAVAVRGPAVADLEHAFAALWKEFGSPLPAEQRISIARCRTVGEVSLRVVIQDPGEMHILRVLQVLAAGVEHRLWIADAYFLSVPVLHQALLAAARDGADVRLLLPSTNDIAWIGTASRAGYRPLLDAGVRIWEYRGPMMHAKTTVVDGWFSRIGSTGLNIAGLWTNWELDLVIENREFAARMEAMFENDLIHADEVRLDGGPHSLWPNAGEVAGKTAQRRGRRPHLLPTSGGGGSLAASTIARVGGAALSGRMLDRAERTVTRTLSAGALGVSLLGARWPRLIAWPVSAVAGLMGAAGWRRAARGRPAPPAVAGTDVASVDTIGRVADGSEPTNPGAPWRTKT